MGAVVMAHPVISALSAIWAYLQWLKWYHARWVKHVAGACVVLVSVGGTWGILHWVKVRQNRNEQSKRAEFALVLKRRRCDERFTISQNSRNASRI
jgi:hypothetical protein